MGNTVGRQFFISKLQREVALGCLLGDGRLECRSKTKSARLRIHHGWKQKDFVFWKYGVFKNLVLCPPKKIVCGKNLKNNEDYYSWYFHTRTTTEFKEMYKMFYSGKTKVLPKNISDLLTPITLAVWIMDDGCNDGKSLIVNTHNFSFFENEKLRKILRSKLSIISRINKDRNRWRLRLDNTGTCKLRKIIEPYIIPSMRYKIVPVETSRTIIER